MNFKKFYELYHQDRKLPKRIITNKNFTYRSILSVLDKYCKSKDVLDIGSGVGTIDFYLAQKGKNITGIEISEKALDIAEKSSRLFGLEKSITYKRIDFLKSKLNEKYNFVICLDVLEHLPNDRKAVQKISKLIKNGGLLLLTVPSKNAPFINLKATKDFDKLSGHLRKYSLQEAKNILNECGFKILFSKRNNGILTNSLYVFKCDQIIRIANRFGLISDLFIALDNLSLIFFGESGLILVARKI